MASTCYINAAVAGKNGSGPRHQNDSYRWNEEGDEDLRREHMKSLEKNRGRMLFVLEDTRRSCWNPLCKK